VTSLGKTREPEAEKFLLLVAQDKAKIEGSDTEKQQSLDVRLAATRALGNFNDRGVQEVLEGMAKNEKDVALRDCAQDAFAASNGPKPFVEKTWEEVFPPAYPREVIWTQQPKPPSLPADGTAIDGLKEKILGPIQAVFHSGGGN
jgi:hypothetical protein